jgi:hypothetical protein
VNPWTSGIEYKPDQQVTNGKPLHKYQCRPWPNGLWCAFDAYQPGEKDGPWMDAWTDLGPCQ